jgi:hypothetical protein
MTHPTLWLMVVYECENKIEMIVDICLQNISNIFVPIVCLFKLSKFFHQIKNSINACKKIERDLILKSLVANPSPSMNAKGVNFANNEC